MKKTSVSKSQFKFGRLLVIALMVIAALHIVSVIVSNNSPSLTNLAGFFDVDREHNFPTAYNSLLWIAAGVTAGLLTLRAKALYDRLRWGFIAALFVYFGLDDFLIIHEQMAEPLRKLLHVSNDSLFYHAWIIPALLVALCFGLYLVFFRDRSNIAKEQKTVYFLVFLVAAGAVTLEGLGTKFYFSGNIYRLGPVLAEELFEMSMASLLLYKLRGYLTSR